LPVTLLTVKIQYFLKLAATEFLPAFIDLHCKFSVTDHHQSYKTGSKQNCQCSYNFIWNKFIFNMHV